MYNNNEECIIVIVFQVTVHVIDSNDLPPVFSLSEYFASSKEDVSIGTSIIRVTATDGDLGSNAEVKLFFLKVRKPNSCIIDTS